MKNTLLLLCLLTLLLSCESKEVEQQKGKQQQEVVQEVIEEEPIKQKKITDCEIIPDGSSAVSPRIDLKNGKDELRILFRSTPNLKTIYTTFVDGDINSSDVTLHSKDGGTFLLTKTEFDAVYHTSVINASKYNEGEFERLLNFDIAKISVILGNGKTKTFTFSEKESDNFNCYLNKIYEY